MASRPNFCLPLYAITPSSQLRRRAVRSMMGDVEHLSRRIFVAAIAGRR
jgi:hypothetical protein